MNQLERAQQGVPDITAWLQWFLAVLERSLEKALGREVERLCCIKRAQQLGFTLREVGELLGLGDGACQEVQELATAKLAEIEDRLRDLTHMRDVMADHLAACRKEEAEGGCPLVRILGGGTVEQNLDDPHPDKDVLLQRSGED